jgi:hypothetical protein
MNLEEEINDLASTTNRLWLGNGQDESTFSSTAAAVLREFRALDNVSLEELHSQFALFGRIGVEYGFGEPNVIAWSSERFRIEFSYWYANTTTLHDHAFSGAFRVLLGAAVENIYSFHGEETPSPMLTIGKLERIGITLLTNGSISQFPATRDYVHGVVPVISPTCILTLRTHRDALPSLQREFLWPNVAFALDENSIQQRRSKLLWSIAQNDIDIAKSVIAKSAPQWGDIETALVLLATTPSLAAVLGDHIQGFFEKDGYLLKVIAAIRRRCEAFAARAEATDPMLRLLLGLSGIDDDLKNALGVLKSQYGLERADNVVSGWLQSIHGARELAERPGKRAEAR